MIQVITVEREYGSRGAEYAHHLAHRLGWKLIDSCLVEDVAGKAGVTPTLVKRCDERVDPWFYRFGKAIWLGGHRAAPGRSRCLRQRTHGGVGSRLRAGAGHQRQLRSGGPRRRLHAGQVAGSLSRFCLRLAGAQDSLR